MFKRSVTALAFPERQHRKSTIDAFGTRWIKDVR